MKFIARLLKILVVVLIAAGAVYAIYSKSKVNYINIEDADTSKYY